VNNFKYMRSMRSFQRALFFSLVKVPAFFLFAFFLVLSFNASISGTFLDSARDLVAGAPAGKVWVCERPLKKAPLDLNKPSVAPFELQKPAVTAVPCKKTLVSAEVWQTTVDKTVRSFYVITVLFSLFYWIAMNELKLPSLPVKWFRRKNNEH
jgi:hypothetical protein